MRTLFARLLGIGRGAEQPHTHFHRHNGLPSHAHHHRHADDTSGHAHSSLDEPPASTDHDHVATPARG